MKRQSRALLFALTGTMMFIGFQNCARSGVAFNQGNVVSGKLVGVDSASLDESAPLDEVSPVAQTEPPAETQPVAETQPASDPQPTGVSQGDGDEPTQPPPVVVQPPVVDQPPQQEADNDPTEHDYDGKSFNAACGVSKFVDSTSQAAAEDLNIKNGGGFLNVPRAGKVTVEGFVGMLKIGYATSAPLLKNMNIVLSRVNSAEIGEVKNVSGAGIAFAARKLGSIADLKVAGACVSAGEIGKISNVHASVVKVVGDADPNAPRAHAGAIENVHGIMSLARLKVDDIHDVHGYLIIRDSDIASLSNIQGNVTLINTHVGKIQNVKGIVRMINSHVDDSTQAPMLLTAN